jgi:hypothetical protein
MNIVALGHVKTNQSRCLCGRDGPFIMQVGRLDTSVQRFLSAHVDGDVGVVKLTNRPIMTPQLMQKINMTYANEVMSSNRWRRFFNASCGDGDINATTCIEWVKQFLTSIGVAPDTQEIAWVRRH